jgi:hypothetical protein
MYTPNESIARVHVPSLATQTFKILAIRLVPRKRLVNGAPNVCQLNTYYSVVIIQCDIGK